MKNLKVFATLFFSMLVLFASPCSLRTFAAETDALEITITADKENYSTGDTVKLNVNVKNNNSYTIDSLSLEGSISDNFTISENKNYSMKLEPSESKDYTITAKQNNQDSPQTGVTPPIIPAVLLGASLIFVTFTLIKNKKARKMLAVVLCVTSISGFCFDKSSFKAIAAEYITVTKESTFKYNNKDITAKITAKYEDMNVIIVNTSPLGKKQNDASYNVTEVISTLDGTLRRSNEIKEFSYKITDMKNAVVGEGTLPVAEKWVIENFGLVVGGNNVVLTAVDNDNKTYTTKLKIFNSNIENMNNTNVDLTDDDNDKLSVYYENWFGTDSDNPDSDNDGLPDGYEAMTLGTVPVSSDSNTNGVSDYDEDFDNDALSNGEEWIAGTDPLNNDTDGDTLSDGDELKTHHTDPLVIDTDADGLDDADEVYFGTNPNLKDTDGNGVLDGDEKREQTFIHQVENTNCAVSKVQVQFKGTGNIQKSTNIKSVMNRDMICSEVVGLVGEPFSIETTSQFEKAVITFQINPNLLGETDFNDLLFLWYDEVNCEFVEIETLYNATENTVSMETTHFSKYMVVDKKQWFKAWAQTFNYNPSTSSSYAPTFYYNTVLAIDCSGSMKSNDPINTLPVSSPSDSVYARTCGRIKAADGFIDNMNSGDKAAIVCFTSSASVAQTMTTDKTLLKKAVQSITSNGGTSFSSAITTAISTFSKEDLSNANMKNRIILLSDGEDSVSNSILDQANNNDIKIYTIGLGDDSHDYILKNIASYTGGEFYKAYDAAELINIYKEIGISGDFDTTDTDGDGLYDAVEAAGIRLENGRIINGCDPANPDTDNDGIPDGKEIDPTIRWKAKHYYPSDVPEFAIDKEYYFVMKSDPVGNDDYDRDGYADIFDPDPKNYEDYSFLNEEIHYIGIYDDSKNIMLPLEATSGAINKANDFDSNGGGQYFRFKWVGNGYKLCSVQYESSNMVITAHDNGGYYTVTLEPDKNKAEQIWEIAPHGTIDEFGNYNSDGMLFRNKALNRYDSSPCMYLSSKGGLSLSSTKSESNRLKIYSPFLWKRFGEIYLNYIGWEQTDVPFNAMQNYYNNVKINIDPSSNINNYNGHDLLLNQSGGNFPKLYFKTSTMNDVCCEIMGTYNALLMKNIQVDFFKLAVEFEQNGINIVLGTGSNGMWGNDPYKICNCLDAYNVSYTTIDIADYPDFTAACNAYDAALKKGVCGIISYNWTVYNEDIEHIIDCSMGVGIDAYSYLLRNDSIQQVIKEAAKEAAKEALYLGIHTYATVYDTKDPANPIKTFNKICKIQVPKDYASTDDAMKDSTNMNHFMIGYVLN